MGIPFPEPIQKGFSDNEFLIDIADVGNPTNNTSLSATLTSLQRSGNVVAEADSGTLTIPANYTIGAWTDLGIQMQDSWNALDEIRIVVEDLFYVNARFDIRTPYITVGRMES